jgi:hypothetical protein
VRFKLLLALTLIIFFQTAVGVNGNTVYAIPHDRLKQVMRKYNRLQ